MSSHPDSRHQKVRLTVECSFDERTYIKMLAAKKHVTISELLLAPWRDVLPSEETHEPNAETIEALKESREKKLVSYETIDDFWKAMGIDPNA
jgi:hypothetical protein